MRYVLTICLTMLITACGFHLQGETPLAPALHKLYLQTPDPYGHLARDLRQALKASHVELTNTAAEAKTILVIQSDNNSQHLLSVSGTQQTRQYKVVVTVVFEITDKAGHTLVNPQTLTESRIMTVQSNQILASSNEANLYYQQMRRNLAYSIMNRLSSIEVTNIINHAFPGKASR